MRKKHGQVLNVSFNWMSEHLNTALQEIISVTPGDGNVNERVINSVNCDINSC